MTLRILAPVGGEVVAMAQVPDPVFAESIVGPGLAVNPTGQGEVDALAPVAGTIAKFHPHAFVIVTEQGRGVLVHLGLDTVQLKGQGFTLHAAEQDTVTAGQRLVSWNPAQVAEGGRSPVCPVIALEGEAQALSFAAEPGTTVAAGDELFTWS